MVNPSLPEHSEEVTEKEEPTLISKEKAKHPCKCSEHRAVLHKKEVFSDGWTKWICSKCGQVKFTRGKTSKEDK